MIDLTGIEIGEDKATEKMNYILFLVPFLILMSTHIIPILFLQQPHIFCDEIGYLGNARYLSGAFHMPDLRGCSYYHFGYSIFIIPAFWLSSDPVIIYKLVAVINSILLSSLYLCLYYFSCYILGNSVRVSILASFVACLYPSFLLQSNFAWTESLFIPLYVLTVLSLFLMVRSNSFSFSVVFGFLSAFIYTVHPRGLSIVFIAVFFICMLAVLKLISRIKACVALLTLVATCIATKLISSHLIAIGWGGVGKLSALNLLTKLISVSGIKHLVLASCGQLLYLSVSTYGLFIVGLLYVLAEVIKRYKQRTLPLSESDIAKIVSFLFVLATSLGVFLASSSFMAVFEKFENLRGDHLVYGRYNEGFLAVYLLCAFSYLSSIDDRNQRRFVRVLVIGVISFIALFLRLSYANNLLNKHGYALNMFGIFPFVRELGWLDLGTISLIAIMLFLIISLLSERSVKLAVSLAGSLFLIVALYDLAFYVLPPQLSINERTTLASYINKLDHVPCISYDMSFYNDKISPIRYFSYQWLLPDVKFIRFYSEEGNVPTCGVVISGNCWKGAEALNARYVASERGVDQALWVLPGKAQDKLRRSYVNIPLGGKRFPGVWESGFHHQEHYGGTPARWTNGHAKLVVPVGKGPLPASLKIGLVSTGPKGADLSIIVNSHRLFEGHVGPGGWTKVLPIENVVSKGKLVIELVSSTFVPKYVLRGSKDNRVLGVFVKNIILLTRGRQ